ncbi:MAG: peptidase carboxypeptidase [Lacunisphaera sp.]|nr:peptidase carboxypeptidase [Lacunisphaera sp.]
MNLVSLHLKLLRGPLLAAVCLLATTWGGAEGIPSPREYFGFNIGDDYQVPNFTQAEAYFKQVAATSPRAKLTEIGLTEEGRMQYLMVVTSPENLKKVGRYQEIARQLAHAEGLTDAQARALAAEGKAIVWIDGGLHANETVGFSQLIEAVWQLNSRDDAETRRILNDVVILFVTPNPDGNELVGSWYMRSKDPARRSYNDLPRLFQKYIGHDNNRDFLLMNMKESRNLVRQLYVDWIPQIVYNHHQPSPRGAVVAGPPYADPFNYVFDPLLVTSIDALGAAMNSRLNLEGKPGYTQRGGPGYGFSAWWNGGLRTMPYFHNMIGILTEIHGSPWPTEIALVPDRLTPNSITPFPVPPQQWHYRQSIDYSISLNYAVLDYASRHRDELLYNIYAMGKKSIERGSADYWTLDPRRVAEIRQGYATEPAAAPLRERGVGSPAAGTPAQTPAGKYYDAVMKDPKLRDPRGYIVPADQSDFPTAVKFINALIRAGVSVQQATGNFTVAGKNYPAGSYVVKTAQAFRPHVIDMFEPQHPDADITPGDPTSWTLAYEMGVHFDRILDGFDGPFARIPYGELQSPPKGNAVASATGWLLSPLQNDSFILVNRLLAAGAEVYRLPEGAPEMKEFGRGTFYVAGGDAARSVLEKGSDLGVSIVSAAAKSTGGVRVAAARIALWDKYGGSMPSGWLRWIFEQYGFPFEVIYPGQIDAGGLRAKYDVIVFPTGAIPELQAAEAAEGHGDRGGPPRPEEIPEEYRSRLGSITSEHSIPQIRQFLEQGGRVVTIGSSTSLAYHLGLPVRDALVEMGPDKSEIPLSIKKLNIVNTILRATVDLTQPAAWGMAGEADIFFDDSPVFHLAPEAVTRGVTPIAWYASAHPLRSGRALGEAYLKDGLVGFTAPVGKGMLYAYGPEVAFRGQMHGTFKFLFNTLYLAK